MCGDMDDVRAVLKGVLGTLTFRERGIVSLRYGIEDGHTYTLAEVARIFKVTRERVRQIEAKALRKLNHPTRCAQFLAAMEAAGLVVPNLTKGV